MDLEYMGRLVLSMAIFAPGLILLAFLAFLGLVMLAEKANMFRSQQRVSAEADAMVQGTAARNPAPGRITEALTDDVAAEAAGEEQGSDKVQKLRENK